MVDIGLSGSVVELLARVTGVSGSSPGPALYFHCICKCLFLLSHYFIYIVLKYSGYHIDSYVSL